MAFYWGGRSWTHRSYTVTPSGGFDRRWLGAAIPEVHWHFHRRLLERYDIVLAPGDFAQLMKDIRHKRAVLVDKRSCDRAIYAVTIESSGACVYVLARWPHIYTAWPPGPWIDELWRHATRTDVDCAGCAIGTTMG